MVKKIVAGVCFFLAAIALILMASGRGVSDNLPIVLVFVPIGLFALLKKGKSREEKAEIKAAKAARDEVDRRSFAATHAVGLPLAEGANCGFSFGESGVVINGGGNQFNLSYNKITDMSIKTETEVHEAYVSSVGGAVGGAVLFGPLGAMVGGRAKKKETRTVEQFLIITYQKDDAVGYISCRVFSPLKVRRLIDNHKSRFAKITGPVEL